MLRSDDQYQKQYSGRWVGVSCCLSLRCTACAPSGIRWGCDESDLQWWCIEWGCLYLLSWCVIPFIDDVLFALIIQWSCVRASQFWEWNMQICSCPQQKYHRSREFSCSLMLPPITSILISFNYTFCTNTDRTRFAHHDILQHCQSNQSRVHSLKNAESFQDKSHALMRIDSLPERQTTFYFESIYLLCHQPFT